MSTYLPLDGVRVISFEVAASLPAGTRTLADLGADVLRVAEPPGQASPWIRVFDSSLINKRSIVINLRQAEGRQLALRLAAAADVVCNNFRPHVLAQFGLGHATLLELKPRLIVVQLTGYGAPGPWQDYPAYGPSVEAAGGMNAQMGLPDELPQRVGGGVFADTLAGRYAALAVCAALVQRDITGKGRYVDVSMYECIVAGVGDLVLRAAHEQRPPPRQGNRSEQFAPQGIYPARGEDEWVALTVASDEEWRALRRLLDDRALDDPSFEPLEGRRSAHDAIDRVIARWTAARDKVQAAEELQGAGIAAGPVQKTGDLPLDPQYAARRFFQQVRHAEPIAGYSSHPHMRLPAHFAGHARRRLSDHNGEGTGAEQALQAWLGLDAGEVERLRSAGAFGPARPVVPAGLEPPGWFGARHAERHDAFAERLGLLPAPETGRH